MYYLIDGILLGAILTYYLIKQFFRIERKHPYGWSCDECKFAVSTNNDDPDLLMRMVDKHKEYHTRGEWENDGTDNW